MKDGVSSRSRPQRRFRTAVLGVASAAAIAAAGGGLFGLPHQPAVAANDPLGQAVQQEDFERGYADLVARVMPAVVRVEVEKTAEAQNTVRGMPFDDPDMRDFFERFFGQPLPMPQPEERRQEGVGSGFVIDPAGWIVTNAHVVDGADKITVVMNDGERHEGEIKGIDPKTDLALVKIEAGNELPYVGWGDSGKVRVGDKVLAVGNPFGLGGTVTAGIVSATGREIGAGPYDDFLQLDAAINRGNSGGPTFNLDGEVVGVNSIIFSPSGGNVGIGFAISSNLAKDVIEQLKDTGAVVRGWLGVGIQELDPDLASSLGLDKPEGALVTKVEPDSPGAQAGLESGDVIVGFNDQGIEHIRDLTRAVADAAPGKQASVKLIRGGDTKTVEVGIGKMPTEQQVAATAPDQSADQPRLGLQLATLTPDVRQRMGISPDVEGVLIQGVEPDGPAASKGLRPGDIILRVGDQPVNSADKVVELVRKAHDEGKENVLVLFQRDGSQLYAAIPFAVS
jgi:serine protease Do